MTKIIIADDHRMFCEGIEFMFENDPTIEIIGNAQNGIELLTQLNGTKPDLILMDINMSEMDGIEASEKILRDFPTIKIIMLSMYKRPEIIKNLIKLGVHGYVLKDVGKTELTRAIKRVMANNFYFGEEVLNSLVSSLKAEKVEDTVSLTKREKDILLLICKSKTTSDIAEELNISPNTVESHRKNLLAKTASTNSIGLVNFAYKNHLIG